MLEVDTREAAQRLGPPRPLIRLEIEKHFADLGFKRGHAWYYSVLLLLLPSPSLRVELPLMLKLDHIQAVVIGWHRRRRCAWCCC